MRTSSARFAILIALLEQESRNEVLDTMPPERPPVVPRPGSLEVLQVFEEETVQASKPDLTVVLTSFGWKNQEKPPKADLYLDCRAMTYHPISALPGDAVEQVLLFETNRHLADAFRREVLISLLDLAHRRDDKENIYADPFIVACACAHGMHRSVAMKKALFKLLQDQGLQLEVK
jgi:RNase adaptor protein for sRNA GlmZ degradation